MVGTMSHLLTKAGAAEIEEVKLVNDELFCSRLSCLLPLSPSLRGSSCPLFGSTKTVQPALVIVQWRSLQMHWLSHGEGLTFS